MLEDEGRYAGRPMVRLLECYVMQAIGELNKDHMKVLKEMEPKLREIYGREGSWAEIISEELELRPELSERLRAMWKENKERGANAGVRLEPEDFAKMVVDKNFGWVE